MIDEPHPIWRPEPQHRLSNDVIALEWPPHPRVDGSLRTVSEDEEAAIGYEATLSTQRHHRRAARALRQGRFIIVALEWTRTRRASARLPIDRDDPPGEEANRVAADCDDALHEQIPRAEPSARGSEPLAQRWRGAKEHELPSAVRRANTPITKENPPQGNETLELRSEDDVANLGGWVGGRGGVGGGG